ncbi:glycoside hydrolase family 2 TIM barrel-domain containing protein [Paratractidigestivibacter sp.]|uniref:glycoside hydrolase family 2 TIM barrel-domain containing protein n=1 Tax=Paratractidigestivibacter sp. TaxID=2847316 RepID=UPI002AC9A9F4|nr:glycoside hydrolase family 2 TIM barrel-domain containing protein [Paratractidigestivibacter sp.]
MRAISLNEGWSYRHLAREGAAEEAWQQVRLPHDAMIFEPRDERAPSAHNSGWFAGRDYEYVRELSLPEGVSVDAAVVLEFEGVYHLAEVWLDGEKVCERPYGYTNFLVDLTGRLSAGKPSELRVIARNSDQPNSRWYSGAGIYRPVSLWVGSATHVTRDGVNVRTLSVGPARVAVDVETTGAGKATVEVTSLDDAGVLAAGTVDVPEDGRATLELDLPGARPWSCESPQLYRCNVALVAPDGTSDEACAVFGVRTLAWGDEGLLVNGERVILKGACIHHDNGILGACAWPDAIDRKVKILREQGYNALRSAHNPCSRALLDACDRQGVMVMDEYIDHWYIHKTQHDYVDYFDEWWRQDLTDMVAKDRVHPCVVAYSTGNEVSETAEKRGIELSGAMTEHLHVLDPTRPVSCGVNIFFNFLSSVGFGQYSDEKAAREAEAAAKLQAGDKPAKKSAVGSEFFNNLAGIMGAGFMKRGATLPFCDWVTRDAYAAMDMPGYNYGIDRYKHDLRAYPHRLILGSETFCSDAWRFMQLAEKNPRLVGDFVWAGIDYLGEASVGSWEYSDYAPRTLQFGWLTAGSGRVDLTGRPLGEALYTRVALGGEVGPYVAVCPVNHTGEKHSPSAWKMSNATDSWAWEGCEGRVANVEVYARAASVALMLNGREVARRSIRGDVIARMSCTWEPGCLEAVSYDEKGVELGRARLVSAEGPARLVAEPEYVGERDGLVFVRVRYADGAGTTMPLERGMLRASVRGGELLAFGCACPFNPGSFVTGQTDTYYGEALAVVRAEKGARATLSVTDGTLLGECEISR